MDPSSSVGKTWLGENVIEISSDKAEGHGDWNSLEFQDPSNSRGKKETKAMEVKCGNKVVKKELIIDLRGEIYFVKFIINPEEDDVEPCVVFGRSFLRLTKAIADFRNEIVKIYPELDPFLFVCRMGKSSRNKRKQLKKYQLIYSDMGPSMSTGTPLSQEEAKREALAINIYERYSLLEEERSVIKIMAYSEKYKKILDEICFDKRKLDGMNKKEEEAIIKIKGKVLIENFNPGAFVIPIRLEGKINLNALDDTGLNVNVIPYRIYKELGREEVGVTTIIAKFLILDMPIDRDTPILVGKGFLHTCGGILNTIDNITSTFDGICHQTFHVAKTSLDIAKSESDDEE
uniref:Reverse transcriptase domain-containing protein n=1 Tax=Tanacetum cinerariifolium TaxID=118510 RepID=A0A6L2MEU2_TANCI|nr:hypothetical protein [Tanacetum cinerariifolium]